MKKIIGLFLLVLLILGGYFGYNYWKDVYRGEVAYAIVPTQVPEKKQTLDQNGKVQSGLYTYEYSLDFIKKNGEVQTMEFNITDANPVPLTPNSYVEAKISKKRLLEGPNQINKADIPASIVNHLKEN
jgi:uncharacterized protein YxeA